ncbi:wax ester/triacylglycerol synthase domain-containing protein [Blastococcus sp. URHD0036]|uniref:wax ester/triacylglycerol synthase domain-containing protein n=1 Tax=Blastococcus sp. URHD0036 TaxID=1380356 RepID=UPI000559715B|nr:wax ester/triacylglycerol synthase domain-containing protein [Blastococcus sp. URHD0036]
MNRADPADLAMRSMGGQPPMQLAAVLVLAPGAAGPGEVAQVLIQRLGALRRLRRRLVRVPPGGGRPVWVDDPGADPARHVRQFPCPPPGDEQALLDLATELVSEPLPADRPAWAATVVPGLRGDRTGVVVVLSHIVADGIGGLGLLGAVVDGAPPAGPEPVEIRPPYPVLAAEAMRSRGRALLRWRTGLPALRDAVRAAGGPQLPRALDCSLLAPTGPRRRAAALRVDLGRLRASAHRAGGTVNDALLIAVAGALGGLLCTRGEAVDPVLVTVVVSARRVVGPDDAGNANTPLVVAVPVAGSAAERLRAFAGTVRAARDSATGPSLPALLGPLFRLLAATGAYRWYLRHQRRFHTLVSNVPGPDHPLALAGRTVERILPLAVGEAGNVTVAFGALSYAGALTVTAVADPDRVPDLPVLMTALRQQFDALVEGAQPSTTITGHGA